MTGRCLSVDILVVGLISTLLATVGARSWAARLWVVLGATLAFYWWRLFSMAGYISIPAVTAANGFALTASHFGSAPK